MAQDCAFKGSPDEDPYRHVHSFLEICSTVKINGVTPDVIRLCLFSFSVQDKAKAWLESLMPGNITTWDGLAQAFLNKFSSLAKTMRLRTEIGTFKQNEGKQLFEVWER